MRPRDLTARLTGFSTPAGGLQWQPRPAEIDLAREVVTFLEDRRVLYVPEECEMPKYCVESVLEIRRKITDVLAAAAGREPLTGSLQAIRAACRRFLDHVGDDVARGDVQPWRGGTPEWTFNQALGELRASVGIHVALIADRHDLDVEARLAQILPPTDDDPDWLLTRFDS